MSLESRLKSLMSDIIDAYGMSSSKSYLVRITLKVSYTKEVLSFSCATTFIAMLSSSKPKMYRISLSNKDASILLEKHRLLWGKLSELYCGGLANFWMFQEAIWFYLHLLMDPVKMLFDRDDRVRLLASIVVTDYKG